MYEPNYSVAPPPVDREPVVTRNLPTLSATLGETGKVLAECLQAAWHVKMRLTGPEPTPGPSLDPQDKPGCLSVASLRNLEMAAALLDALKCICAAVNDP